MKLILIFTIVVVSFDAIGDGILSDVRAIADLTTIYGITAEEAQVMHIAMNRTRRAEGERELTYEQEADLARRDRALGWVMSDEIRRELTAATARAAEKPATLPLKSPEERRSDATAARNAREEAKRESQERAILEARKQEEAKVAAEAARLQKAIKDAIAAKRAAAIADLRARSEAELKALAENEAARGALKK